jgi:hypothetical protein
MSSIMRWTVDARIPVTLVEEAALGAALAAGAPAAVLMEAPPPEALPAGAAALVSFDPGHVAGCACCGGRSGAAAALDRLFQARVRGGCAWFDRVLAVVETPEARAELESALSADALTVARYRLVGGPGAPGPWREGPGGQRPPGGGHSAL